MAKNDNELNWYPGDFPPNVFRKGWQLCWLYTRAQTIQIRDVIMPFGLRPVSLRSFIAGVISKSRSLFLRGIHVHKIELESLFGTEAVRHLMLYEFYECLPCRVALGNELLSKNPVSTTCNFDTISIKIELCGIWKTLFDRILKLTFSITVLALQICVSVSYSTFHHFWMVSQLLLGRYTDMFFKTDVIPWPV